jgi:hypothetical protein
MPTFLGIDIIKSNKEHQISNYYVSWKQKELI